MKTPFELDELRLFLLVSELQSFTRAAAQANLSQSALTRQIQGLEARLGAPLFLRTTRTVRLSPAGEFWAERARRLLQQSAADWDEFTQSFAGRPPLVRVGVCRTISLAYLPGFFHAYRRRRPDCRVELRQDREPAVLGELDSGAIDVAILPEPRGLPNGCGVVHAFADGFTAIGPEGAFGEEPVTLAELREKPLILLDTHSSTGQWLRAQLHPAEPVMEFDNFDLIVNAVALGLGYALTPHRALAIYARNRRFARAPLAEKLERTLCVITSTAQPRAAHLSAFLDSILF